MARRTLTRAEWLQRLDDHALIHHGGRCLSPEYLRSQANHWFQCREGHAFEARPANVLHRGSWCPFCAGNARLSLEMFEAVAEAHGGKLLPYDGEINRYSALSFRCAAGHEFEITLQNYGDRRRGFCIECEREAEREWLLERAAREAAMSGYVLLSTEWVTAKTRLLYRCPAGHEWRCRDWEFRVAGTRCGVCWRISSSRAA